MADIVDYGIVEGDVPYIWRVGGFMLLVAEGHGLLYCRELFGIQIRYGIREDCSGTRLLPCGELHAQEFDKIGTASLITRTTNDITQVQQVTIMILRMMAIAPMMCIGDCDGRVERPGTDDGASDRPADSGTGYFPYRQKGIPLFKAIQVKIDTLSRVFAGESDRNPGHPFLQPDGP